MPELHVLRVFCGEAGSGGNPLGVFLDGSEVPTEDRQGIAGELGFSETVFVDDAERGEMRIFTPAVELPFAGHPVVGTAWLLARERDAVAALRPPAGEVPVRTEDGLTYAAARPEWSPPFEFVRGQLSGGRGGPRRASPGPRRSRGLGVGRSRPRASFASGSSPRATGSPRTRRLDPRRSPSRPGWGARSKSARVRAPGS